jgi:hypothetical protein
MSGHIRLGKDGPIIGDIISQDFDSETGEITFTGEITNPEVAKAAGLTGGPFTGRIQVA